MHVRFEAKAKCSVTTLQSVSFVNAVKRWAAATFKDEHLVLDNFSVFESKRDGTSAQIRLLTRTYIDAPDEDTESEIRLATQSCFSRAAAHLKCEISSEVCVVCEHKD